MVSKLIPVFLASAAACSSPGTSSLDAATVENADAQVAGDASPDCTLNTYYMDADGDSFGTPDLIAVDCQAPEGFVDNDLDCNDSDERFYPGATEYCDGLDTDCDIDTPDPICPSGCLVQLNGSDRYLFCSTKATHAAASSVCEGQAMHLVRVDSAEEQAFLRDQRVVAFGSRPFTWIGATDAAAEATWVWMDGTQFWQGGVGGSAVDSQYSFWRIGDAPDNSGNQDCAALRDNSSGAWVDKSCSDDYRFICEWDPPE